MSNPSSGRHDHIDKYEIRVKGHLEPRWSAWFEGMTLTTHDDGTTVVVGAVVDQAALQGLLRKIHDIGVQLISVTQLDQAEPTSPHEIPNNHSTEG